MPKTIRVKFCVRLKKKIHANLHVLQFYSNCTRTIVPLTVFDTARRFELTAANVVPSKKHFYNY